ncbi:ABC transporter substrate-binding protein [Marinobacter sp.]|uniref:ABC transporter substrate-binding protein n=1 Tax=Marinobacter sp. TaxID=50741 RepID=UPI000C6A3938|nr:ABC transporter substrate-binding protein [Marinobacter sp.]MBE97376.1 branched-chain amino acid ABC transporter substrate-binding protein [Marinobacter sp.]|tara:strand:- start:1891 stop:3021 length:1131 start_codon:yes stop_codon:yes gene_type:complete
MLRKTLSFLVLAAGISSTSAALADDISIGAVFPLSGPNATYGDIFMSGADLAAEHVNEDGLLSGDLNILYEDSQALPQQGVVAMNKLVNVEGVPYTLSAFTGVSKAISTLAQRSQTVAVNGGGVGPDLAKLGDYFWNVIPLANNEVGALARYAVNDLGHKRFTLVYVDDPLGESILNELEKTLPPLGAELVESHSIAASAQQFSGVAARVRSDNPDVVYVASYGSQQLQIVKQLRDNGVKAQIASYSAFSVPELQEQEEAQGALFTTQSIEWDSNDSVTKRFVDDYRAEHDKNPTSYIANYYNAVRVFALLAQALEAQGKEITGANLLAQRKATATFKLVGGEVSFQENGTLLAPIQVLEVDGSGSGKVVSVKAGD